MSKLKTDFKDDVLDVSKNIRRKYQLIQNSDGTVSFEDVTEYLQNGDLFGSTNLNEINLEVNKKCLNDFGAATELNCGVKNIMSGDGIIQFEGLTTASQYSSAWLEVNNVKIFNAQAEETGGKTMRHLFSWRVNSGDIVMAKATAGGKLTFRPLVVS